MTSEIKFAIGALMGLCMIASGARAFPPNNEAYTVEAAYTADFWTNVAGGMEQSSGYLDNYDLTFEINAENAWNWSGATFFLYVLGNTNSTLSESIIGDIQTVSNIDSIGAVRLYEAWYEQDLLDGGLSFKVGLLDLNSEFDANDTSGLFLNSSHGIGVDFSQAGENGPSIFPSTSLALRGRVQFTDNWSFQTAVFDGVPGDPDRPRRTVIKLGHGDGALLVSEFGYNNETGTRVSLGTWRFTANIDDVLQVDNLGNPRRRSGNWGAYILGEQLLFHEADDPSQGMTAFLRIGIADENVNQIGRYIGVGAVYTGLFPGREEDQLGLAVAIAENGGPFRRAEQLAGVPVGQREIGVELTYHYRLLERLTLQPDMQVIINPSMDPGMGNAWVFGLRMQVGF